MGVFPSSWKDSWQWAGSNIKTNQRQLTGWYVVWQDAEPFFPQLLQATSLYSLQQENLQTLGAEIERLIKQQRSWRWSKRKWNIDEEKAVDHCLDPIKGVKRNLLMPAAPGPPFGRSAVCLGNMPELTWTVTILSSAQRCWFLQHHN